MAISASQKASYKASIASKRDDIKRYRADIATIRARKKTLKEKSAKDHCDSQIRNIQSMIATKQRDIASLQERMKG